MVKLEVYDPQGNIGEIKPHAPRLSDLAGKTICELSNGKWNDDKTFPLIRELLQKQFPTAKILPYSQFPVGGKIDNDDIGTILKDRGCQAVIVGNAA
jgi:hypothetical protein